MSVNGGRSCWWNSGSGPSASGRLLASWAAPMELEQSAFVKRAQETARTADYTEVQIDE